MYYDWLAFFQVRFAREQDGRGPVGQVHPGRQPVREKERSQVFIYVTYVTFVTHVKYRVVYRTGGLGMAVQQWWWMCRSKDEYLPVKFGEDHARTTVDEEGEGRGVGQRRSAAKDAGGDHSRFIQHKCSERKRERRRQVWPLVHCCCWSKAELAQREEGRK